MSDPDKTQLTKAVKAILPKAQEGFNAQFKKLTEGPKGRSPISALRFLFAKEVVSLSIQGDMLEQRVEALEASKSIHTSAFAAAADDLDDLLTKFMGGHTETKAPDRKASASPILKSFGG